MAVATRTIIYTIYTISCDYCGRVEYVSTDLEPQIHNREMAVRSLGWYYQRGRKCKCTVCRLYGL